MQLRDPKLEESSGWWGRNYCIGDIYSWENPWHHFPWLPPAAIQLVAADSNSSYIVHFTLFFLTENSEAGLPLKSSACPRYSLQKGNVINGFRTSFTQNTYLVQQPFLLPPSIFRLSNSDSACFKVVKQRLWDWMIYIYIF